MYQGTGELGSEGLRHHSGLAVIASVEVLLSAAHGGAEVSGGGGVMCGRGSKYRVSHN